MSGALPLTPGSPTGAAGVAEAAEGEFVITIAGPGKKLFPIAIPDFLVGAGAGSAATEAVEVLRADLEASGYFKLLDPRSFLAEKGEGIEASDIDFEKWFSVGAQGLVKGAARVDGGNVRLEMRLHVDAKHVAVPKRSWKGSPSDVRKAVHAFSNEVVRYFTGEPGIFGSRIAYVRKLGKGRKEVYASEMDGHDPRPMTSNGSVNILPMWGKGGGGVFYTSFVGGNADLWFKSGKKAKKVSSRSGLNVAADVSPTTGLLAATLSIDGNSEIYLLSDSGKIVRRLTKHKGIDTSPSFSPDGKRIAFVSDRHGTPQIWVMNVDGSGVRRLTYRGSYNQSPDWSPRRDGKIVFSARDERFSYDIFAVDPKTGEIERLTMDEGVNEEPTFSPDGRYITFSSRRDGSGYRIFVMNSEGSNQHPITKGSGSKSPTWGPAPRY